MKQETLDLRRQDTIKAIDDQLLENQAPLISQTTAYDAADSSEMHLGDT